MNSGKWVADVLEGAWGSAPSTVAGAAFAGQNMKLQHEAQEEDKHGCMKKFKPRTTAHLR
jgi:hypothetical protein